MVVSLRSSAANVPKEKEKEKDNEAYVEVFYIEVFLTTYVEEIATENRPHAHFSKADWKNIIAKFNKNRLITVTKNN